MVTRSALLPTKRTIRSCRLFPAIVSAPGAVARPGIEPVPAGTKPSVACRSTRRAVLRAGGALPRHGLTVSCYALFKGWLLLGQPPAQLGKVDSNHLSDHIGRWLPRILNWVSAIHAACSYSEPGPSPGATPSRVCPSKRAGQPEASDHSAPIPRCLPPSG